MKQLMFDHRSFFLRSDDGIGEENLRDDEQEGSHVQVLDAACLGD